MDFLSLLASGGGGGLQIPDPLTQATKALTLGELMNRAETSNLALEQSKRTEEARQALTRVLPDVYRSGFSDESMLRAMQMEPSSVGPLTDMLEKKRKSDADYRKTMAGAQKDEADAKIRIAERFGNEADFLSKKKNLTDVQIGDFMRKIAKSDLQDIVTPIPFQVWDKPELAREYLASIGNQFYDIKDRVNAEETNRAHLSTEGMTREENASQKAAREAATAQGWAHVGIAKENAGYNRDMRDSAQGALAQSRLDTKIVDLGKMVEAKGLDSLSASMRNMNNMLERYATKRTIPGVGVVKGYSPGIFLSGEGKNVRATVQGVANDLLKLYSGGAVTLNEAERRKIEMMTGGGFNEADLYNAWPMITERYNEAVRNIQAAFPKEAVDIYKARGATALNPIVAPEREVGRQTSGAITQPGPIQGVKGLVITPE